MKYYIYRPLEERYSDELYHHGVLGMKWGVRRYQNYDGSLKPAGRKHLGVGSGSGGGGGGSSSKRVTPGSHSISNGSKLAAMSVNDKRDKSKDTSSSIKVVEGKPKGNPLGRHTKISNDDSFFSLNETEKGYEISDGFDSFTLDKDTMSAINQIATSQVVDMTGMKSIDEVDVYLDKAGPSEIKYWNQLVNETRDVLLMEIMDNKYRH